MDICWRCELFVGRLWRHSGECEFTMWDTCGVNEILTLLTAVPFMFLDVHLQDVVALELSSSFVRRRWCVLLSSSDILMHL